MMHWYRKESTQALRQRAEVRSIISVVKQELDLTNTWPQSDLLA